jgi:hypothetical protein
MTALSCRAELPKVKLKNYDIKILMFRYVSLSTRFCATVLEINKSAELTRRERYKYACIKRDELFVYYL